MLTSYATVYFAQGFWLKHGIEAATGKNFSTKSKVGDFNCY